MSVWGAKKASVVLRALKTLGWTEDSNQKGGGSHVKLVHPDYPHFYIWAFHDAEEIGPRMLSKIAKQTGLKPSDL